MRKVFSWTAPRRVGVALLLLVLLSPVRPATALDFNLTDGPGLSSLQFTNPTLYNQVRNGFVSAGNLWSNLFSDPVTVNITIEFASLGSGVLGQATSQDQTFAYTDVRNRMILDSKTADDAVATSNLPADQVSMLINRTSNSPFGAGSGNPYLDNDGDANNTTLRLNRATAKALGLIGANASGEDALIEFSSDFGFDFDRSNGITGGQFDFVGVAAHEIGHAIGFVCGCDVLDFNPVNFPDDVFDYVTTLDLFRYSASSFAFGPGTIDWTADSRLKYFSIDGGATPIAEFAQGVNFGDGRQASHWKDGQGNGIMDPAVDLGEFLVITENDIRAFDVMGWDRVSFAVPEPSSLLLMGLAVPVLVRKRQLARSRRPGYSQRSV